MPTETTKNNPQETPTQSTPDGNSEGSKISNVEWALVIGALATVDLTQIVLDLVLIGFVLNPFVDMFVGMSLPLYLHLRGESMANPKRIIGIIVAFLGDGLSDGTLPLWCLDGIFNMMISKSEAVLKNIPGGQAVVSAVEKTK